MIKRKQKEMIQIVVAIVMLAISFFGVGKYATVPGTYSKTIQILDEKKESVMGLTAAATAASAGVSALPGDAASSIADKLADFSSYFLIVLCAIYIEKFSLTLTGFLAFKVLIPIACILYILNKFFYNDIWKSLIKKLVLIAVAIVMIVPTSVKISNMIDETQKESIENAIKSAEEISEAAMETEEEEDEGGFLDFFSKITDGIVSGYDYVKGMLNRFIESIAIMIVTSCVIPVATIWFFVWLIKSILGINVNIDFKMPKWATKAGHFSKNKIKEARNEKVKGIEKRE